MQTNKILLGLFTGIVFSFFVIACQAPATSTTTPAFDYVAAAKAKMPKALLAGIEAHGGLERWDEMQTWAYTIPRNDKPERHFVDLKTRKVRLSHDDYTVGFDGQEVWVTPNKAAFGNGSPRFYHNLIWYFHAFPFIMADPGINYEVLPAKKMNGKAYDAIKISFNAGVGDAPDDYYIAHFDPDTHQMYLLLYTVTYFQGKPGEKYNAIIFDNWKEVNGLLVPASFKGYKYENGELGEQRYERAFTDLELTTTPADPTQFEMPAGAAIDSLIQH